MPPAAGISLAVNQIVKLVSPMVKFRLFADLVPDSLLIFTWAPELLDIYFSTPKLLNLQKGPPESAPKLPIVHLRPFQMKLCMQLQFNT